MVSSRWLGLSRGGPITVIESAAYMARPRLPPPRPSATGGKGPLDYEMVAMKNPAYGPVRHDTHRQEPAGSEEEEGYYEIVEQLDEDAYEIIPAHFQ